MGVRGLVWSFVVCVVRFPPPLVFFGPPPPLLFVRLFLLLACLFVCLCTCVLFVLCLGVCSKCSLFWGGGGTSARPLGPRCASVYVLVRAAVNPDRAERVAACTEWGYPLWGVGGWLLLLALVELSVSPPLVFED